MCARDRPAHFPFQVSKCPVLSIITISYQVITVSNYLDKIHCQVVSMIENVPESYNPGPSMSVMTPVFVCLAPTWSGGARVLHTPLMPP
jgi:hypothetical protein